MPTRIVFSNGDTVTVSDSPESVAELLGSGGLAKLDRPWGDTSIFVNSAEILYIESQDERNPDIEAMEAAEAPAPAPVAPVPAPGGPAPGMPGGPAVQPR